MVLHHRVTEECGHSSCISFTHLKVGSAGVNAQDWVADVHAWGHARLRARDDTGRFCGH